MALVVANQSAMLAAGAAVGDIAFRTDEKRFYRCISVPSNAFGAWEAYGLPAGASIYQDSLTNQWMVARQGESNSALAETVVTPAPAGSITTGTAVLDFGAFPGSSDASVTVTGQAGITLSSVVNVSIRAVDTVDHSADEHWVETIKVSAGNIVAGSGFTIYGMNTNQINEPAPPEYLVRFLGTGQFAGLGQADRQQNIGGLGTRIYGKFNVQWSWS